MLQNAHLEEAELCYAHAEGADLSGAHLEGAYFFKAHLQGAILEDAHLEGANLRRAHLEGAKLINAHLQDTNLIGAYLQGAHFIAAGVDGSTLIWKPEVNWDQKKGNWDFTDFSGVALDSARIDPPTKQLLEYNIRRKYWEKWYREKNWHEIFGEEKTREKRSLWGRIIREPIRWFWAISDYGLSTWRIIVTFFVLAIVFALVYYFLPSLVNDLHGTGHWYSDLVRACYFSVVTMTTLGFGDMFANKQSMAGHILLMFQVILGYVLLGALITRFAVLFTAGGPAGRFAKEK